MMHLIMWHIYFKMWHISLMIMEISNTDFQIIEQIDISKWNVPFAVRRCEKMFWVGTSPTSMLQNKMFSNLIK